MFTTYLFKEMRLKPDLPAYLNNESNFNKVSSHLKNKCVSKRKRLSIKYFQAMVKTTS